jgi:hypothetical protein
MREQAQCGIKALAPLQNSHTAPGVFGKASFFVASRMRRHIVTEKSGDVAPQAEEGAGSILTLKSIAGTAQIRRQKMTRRSREVGIIKSFVLVQLAAAGKRPSR